MELKTSHRSTQLIKGQIKARDKLILDLVGFLVGGQYKQIKTNSAYESRYQKTGILHFTCQKSLREI